MIVEYKMHRIDHTRVWNVMCGQFTRLYGRNIEEIATDNPADVTCQKCFDRMESDSFGKWGGAYIKRYYDVKLPSGEIIKCWPNAGLMNALDGTGRSWSYENNIMVRKHKELANV